jgi:hypothetical protein
MTLPTPITPLQGTVTVSGGLYIRTLPTVKGNQPIGRMVRGTKVKADRRQGGWWHLTSVNDVPVTEESWSFEGYNCEYIDEDIDLSQQSGRVFAYVFKNFERPGVGVSRPTQNGSALKTGGLPDTCKMINAVRVDLTRELQQYWFELLVRSAASSMTLKELRTAWGSLIRGYRAFTNFSGPDHGYADYINGETVNKHPVRFEPIITGGNVVEIVGGPTRKWGKQCWIIRTVDGSKGIAPDINVTNRQTDPYVIFVATNSCRRQWDQRSRRWLNERVEEPFPQLRGRDVPVPLFYQGSTGLIECERVRVLRPGEAAPRPYYP